MKPWIGTALAGLAWLFAIGVGGATGENGSRPAAPAAASADPALVRRDLLARLDALIDSQATEAHLHARLSIDATMPIPYLGVDLETVDKGAKIIAIYPETSAADCGLKVGDLIRAVGGTPVDSKGAVGRVLRPRPLGEPVEIIVTRDGVIQVFNPIPRPRPEEDEDEEEQFPDLPARIVLSTQPLLLTAAGCEPFLGGHGKPGRWTEIAESGRRFIRQEEADKTGIRFPMAIAKDFVAGDVVASARFRYSGGVVDRAAGVVIRWQDAGNYIVARANAAEADLRIFRVANGVRKTLPGAIVKCPTEGSAWHTIELRAEGPRLTATVDGKATTTSWDSFFLSGRVGLWTKSDSVTDFDEVKFEPRALPKPKSPESK